MLNKGDRYDKLIRFDWVLRNRLCDEANFDILEGFLSAILKIRVRIVKLLDNESNQEKVKHKFNCVDLLVEGKNSELILIKIQIQPDINFFHRVVFGTAMLITDHIKSDKDSRNIKKAISINITYFDLGEEKDYFYHGTTNFVGVNEGDTLILPRNWTSTFRSDKVRVAFSEHYIIHAEKFRNEVKNAADEWIYMLKNREVKPEFESKNIQLASEKLRYVTLDEKERRAYENYMENERYHQSMIWSFYEEGRQEGLRDARRKIRQKVLLEDWENEKIGIARRAIEMGIPIETIVHLTSMEVDEIMRIKQQLKL